MTRTASAFSRQKNLDQCVSELRDQLGRERKPPSALLVFASPQLDLSTLLQGLKTSLKPQVLVGCSSAGEFADAEIAEGAVSALAIFSDEMEFRLCSARGIKQDPTKAALEMAASLGTDVYGFPYRYVLLLTDALAGYTEEFLAKLNEYTAGTFQLFGGGAGDDAKFQSTYVFHDVELLQNAAVGLAILSTKPLGLGVRHGWVPLEPGMRATEADGFELVSLNAEATLDVLTRHARETGQRLDPEDPMPFFLHNVLGVATPSGYKIRVPLGFSERGGVFCAAEIPVGSTVHLMRTHSGSAVEAAATAAETALNQLEGQSPAGVIFFDCVATRLRLGAEFGQELSAVRNRIADAAFVGCNSYGQVARVDGQFSGFHNCTAVVCVIPS